MAQKTNLNVSPYYDDFDSSKNFLKVLFKPGFPVQSRELTSLQSILQNQVSDFASHIFKEGSVVIPGSVTYDDQYYAVKVNSTQFGVDLSAYINKYIGKLIIGQSSGTTAKVVNVVFPAASSKVDNITLYVKYIGSDNDFNFTPFENGEILESNEPVTYGNTTISAGSPFASLLIEDATSIGSSASIDAGIYFIRGYFVEVLKQTILLDFYTNTPSYRVGLRISEKLISAKDDSSLYDNAKGFTNFASPGADRLKIELKLVKKDLDDNKDTDFVELLRVKNGRVHKVETKTQYNTIRDYLAQRTFDESGSYSVDPFEITLQESLNDRIGNNGAFFDDEKTNSGNTPSDDLACLKFESGKVYVKGYDVDIKNAVVDVEKPRDTEENFSAVSFEMGNVFKVNNVLQTPALRGKIDLYSEHTNTNKIGEARVYSFNLSDAPYENNSTLWDLRLYDIQTFTKLKLNSGIRFPESTYVKGSYSGASGYIADSGLLNSYYVNLRQTSGTFQKGEPLTFNGVSGIGTDGTSFSVSIEEVTSVYGISDIKSLKQLAAYGNLNEDFTANTVLSDKEFGNGISQVNISASPSADGTGTSGISTITSTGRVFSGITTDTIIGYRRVGFLTETYNRVTSVDPTLTSFTVTGISSVANVFDGALPGSDIQVTPFIKTPDVKGNGTLHVNLSDENVASIDLSNSRVRLIDQIQKPASGGSIITINNSDLTGSPSNTNFIAFDQEYYSIHFENGNIQQISDDSFSNNTTSIQVRKVTDTASPYVANVTFEKSKVQSKVKNFTRSQICNVSYSKLYQSGSTEVTSLNDGLTFNQYYGLRVQDEEICLNYPDVVNVLAIYESLDTNAPILDRVEFSSTDSVVDNSISGENIIGSSSKAVARIVRSSGIANTLDIVYLNDERFSIGESVSFAESNITSSVESVSKGKYKNITDSFNLDKGQKDQYYDYSKIVRNNNSLVPSKSLLIVYDRYDVSSTDSGDLFTVESYSLDRYTNDIPLVGRFEVRASDILDFRPRVEVFNPAAATSSPFDFVSRTSTFNSLPLRLLAPNESSTLKYNYYLPRIDRIYIDTTGKFIVDKGKSSKNPQAPQKIGEFLELATLDLPAYLYNVSDASLTTIDNRRYTMRDIGELEGRIENLEKVTSLSLLELNTRSIQITDSEGRDRFKTGFFVDNFKDFDRLDEQLSVISVDTELQELRPTITRNTLDSLVAASQNFTPQNLSLDTDFTLLDPKVQKTGDSITLAYKEVDWLEQPLATQVENINPFNVVLYVGTVELNPAVDTWTRTTFMPVLNVRNTVNTSETRSSTINRSASSTRRVPNPGRRGQRVFTGTTTSSSTSSSSRTVTSTSVSSRVVLRSRSAEIFMRSRNVNINATNLKPRTRYYQFLDNTSGVDFIPKMLEIARDENLQISGASSAFDIGETIVGTIDGRELLRFRLCHPRHKSGSFNTPDTFYNVNPYRSGEFTDTLYSSSSRVLNVDTFSMSQQAQGDYYGYATVGMKLKGQSSGAEAYVKDLRLVSDNYGDLIGTFFLRNPQASPAPAVRIRTGSKPYRLSSSKSNAEPLPGSTAISFGETNYRATGTLEVYQKVITTTTVNRRITTRITTVTTTSNFTQFYDPLAQSFTVGGNIDVRSNINTEEDSNGVFLTSADIFFANIDENNAPVRVEIRTMELGTPTLNRIGKAVTIRPKEIDADGNEITVIKTSSTGQVATNVKFPEPIFLAPGREYALVLISENSDAYEVWTAVMGEKSVDTSNLPDVDAVVYTQQFALGSIFKSQNGSIWTADQYQDLKFKLYKAEFTETAGSITFFNPPLNKSNGYYQNLPKNPLTTSPKTGYIDITVLENDNAAGILTVGRKLAGGNSLGGSAIISGVGGTVTGISTISAGENYPINLSSKEVETFNISGIGTGLKLSIDTNSNGIITDAIPSEVSPDFGTGYRTGDIVGIVTTSTDTNNFSGNGAQFTISGIGSANRLYLTNIQGELSNTSGKSFSKGDAIQYYDTSSTTVSWASTTITNSFTLKAGNSLLVRHFDHGMYSSANKVELEGIESDLPFVTLDSSITSTESTQIVVSSTTSPDLSKFEGIDVGPNNPGYVKIGNEIIKYESANNGVLETNIVRGIDGTIAESHSAGSIVEKYEFAGVSLRRINNVVFNVKDPEIDHYYIDVDMSTNGRNRSSDDDSIVSSKSPQLSLIGDESAGGDNIYASQNIIYTGVRPTYDITTPGSQTFVNGRIRTISATSVGSTTSAQPSFNDLGFEQIQLNSYNPLSSPRIVCSKENESEYLTSLPRNKSFTTTINFNTGDKNLSPILNLNTAFTEFFGDRLNNPVSNYITDARVNGIDEDPHASVYYSKFITLENPAKSLKVIVSAYRDESADFRVLYSLDRQDSEQVDQSFELFPGYNNLRVIDGELTVIDSSRNSGLPDVKMPSSLDEEFLDYEFTANDLPLFNGFSIKIVMSGTNQAKPPRFKDLRVIAVR